MSLSTLHYVLVDELMAPDDVQTGHDVTTVWNDCCFSRSSCNGRLAVGRSVCSINHTIQQHSASCEAAYRRSSSARYSCKLSTNLKVCVTWLWTGYAESRPDSEICCFWWADVAVRHLVSVLRVIWTPASVIILLIQWSSEFFETACAVQYIKTSCGVPVMLEMLVLRFCFTLRHVCERICQFSSKVAAVLGRWKKSLSGLVTTWLLRKFKVPEIETWHASSVWY